MESMKKVSIPKLMKHITILKQVLVIAIQVSVITIPVLDITILNPVWDTPMIMKALKLVVVNRLVICPIIDTYTISLYTKSLK